MRPRSTTLQYCLFQCRCTTYTTHDSLFPVGFQFWVPIFAVFCVIFVCLYSICTVCSYHHICHSLRLPNAFALNSTHSMAAAGSAAKGISSPVETETLKIEEVQAPATGTRKAKVLYDYDAADSSELSLLADEVRFHHQLAASWSNNDYWPLAENLWRTSSYQYSHSCGICWFKGCVCPFPWGFLSSHIFSNDSAVFFLEVVHLCLKTLSQSRNKLELFSFLGKSWSYT